MIHMKLINMNVDKERNTYNHLIQKNIDINEVIRSFKNTKLKKIINVYQLNYKNSKSMGIGDYLRGCFCLLQVSKLLGIEFDMDFTNHPISKYLQENKEKEKYSINYSDIVKYDDANFLPSDGNTYKKNSLSFLLGFIKEMNLINSEHYFLFSHSFPIFNQINFNSREIIKSKLIPNEELQINIEARLLQLGLKKNEFGIIHIRCGDEYLFDKKNQLNKFKIQKINSIINKNINPNKKYLVLSDNNKIKFTLQALNPKLIIQLNKIAHLGEENQSSDSVKDTLIDFFIMSQSNYILSFSPYAWGSGFSQWCSIMYSIPYNKVILSIS